MASTDTAETAEPQVSGTRTLPFTKAQLEKICERYPTPFHIYDERAIRENVRRLNAAFAWEPGFQEFFAVKAAPNPYLMKILAAEGLGADCSSMAELELAEKAGITGDLIMFSSNETPAEEYRRAIEMGALINLDDISHIAFLEEHASLPELVCFRYNPGPMRTGNTIIGHPEEAKYGLTREQLFEAYRTLRDKGVRRFGLHAMVASNELDPAYFAETVDMLVTLVAELTADLSGDLGIAFEFINMGGGIGIPYLADQPAMDLEVLSAGIREVYEKKVAGTDLEPLKLFMENGRMITGPYGYLVTRAIHTKQIYKDYIGVDASMANLMRPGMYGAYHHVSVPGKEDRPLSHTYDVVGSLCENNDKFAINRKLPEIEIGDLIVIHDAGAHGHAMGFNYNGKLRSAELLLRENGEVAMIRRAESLEDLFATLDLDGLDGFEV